MQLKLMKVARQRLSAFLRACALLLPVILIHGCEKEPPPQPAEHPLKFETTRGLPSEDREVENRFASAIQNNLNVFVAAYRSKWPKVVNTDNARELCQEYAPDGFDVMTEQNKEHRTKYALGTQAPGRALAMEVYKRMLQEQPAESELPLVVFTAGGAGSGKSTSVGSVESTKKAMDEAQIVVDTTLSSPIALEQIQMAIDARKSVQIFYIYRNAESAFELALDRAIKTGRPVTISNFISTHLEAPKALDNVARRFVDEIRNGTIQIEVLDNTGGLNDAKIAQGGLEFVRQKTAGYSESNLRTQLEKVLKKSYEKGNISTKLFEKMNR